MKIRKLLTAFCLAVGLTAAVPTITSTLNIPQTMSVVSAAEGWNQDENGWYYIKDGARLTGLQTIGANTYYLNSGGYRTSGPVTIENTTYYFSPKDGTLYTGVSGMAKSSNESDTYYYFQDAKNGTLVTSKWINRSGKYFYADETGRIKLGTIKVGTKLYHITENGRLTGFAKSPFDKKYYYAKANGVLKTGLQKYNGKLYCFNPTTGQRQIGQVSIGGKTYYFAKKGPARTGWVKLDSKYYYFNKNYYKLTGFQTIDKKLYYLDPAKDGMRISGKWKKISGSRYYFNTKGVIQTGLFKVNDKTFYANSKGQRLTGWQTVNGKKYYFKPNMKTGWVTAGGKKYYLNPTKSSASYGTAKTGFAKIQGSWYYFNQDGSMKTGWLLKDMKYYYLDKKTGKMLTGKQTIDGKSYNFGTSGYFKANISGSWSIQVNRKDCFVVIYKGNTAVKAFVCSTAANRSNTPTGTFSIMDKLYWHELNGPSWGQYCSHITADILFHSVPCKSYNNPYTLKSAEYNKLGTPASGGCIRLSVEHAKWMFDNCPIGTRVYISDSVSKPNIEIEKTPKIALSQTYDPTDTFKNPYSVR